MSQKNTTVEDLKAVRELLSDEKAWTRGHYAIGQNGLPTEPSNKDAVCWCLVGACIKVNPSNPPSEWLYDFCQATGQKTPMTINEYQGYIAVIELLDAAISAAEKEFAHG